MNPDDVLAVVVSYNGCDAIERTVEALRHQVGRIHIVDNGSGPDTIVVLDRLEQYPGVTVARLARNRGVGYALNVGVTEAKRGGYPWVLTMDQDSVVESSFMTAYRSALERQPQWSCLTPTRDNPAHDRPPAGVVPYAITSGNLVRTDLFDQIGPYDEGFFVDCIDFDFCLRLRRAGHHVHRVPDAVMVHQLGEQTRLPALVRRFYAQHPPLRRYYMSRNFFYLAERHFAAFPGFIARLGLLQVLLFVLAGFYDPSPWQSYRAILRGLADYAKRKQGAFGECRA